MDGLVAVNGKVTSPEDAVLPALDRGFLYGDAVFETMVAFDSQILDVPRHLTRLRNSCEHLKLPVPWSDAELSFELTSLVEQLACPKASLRLVLTRGLGMSLKTPAAVHPNRIVYCLPAASEPGATYIDGIALKRMVKAGGSRGASAKTANYLESILALQKAAPEGYQDVLWSNSDGEITEASTANIFFIARQGDEVEFVTPPAASGILLGITRDTLIAVMRQATLPVHEQIVYADELPRFDEAFLCSTVRGLVPVNRIDRHRLHTARSGSIYRHIERLYLTWVETQLGYRVDWATGRRL